MTALAVWVGVGAGPALGFCSQARSDVSARSAGMENERDFVMARKVMVVLARRRWASSATE
jgi:hypothetical protein